MLIVSLFLIIAWVSTALEIRDKQEWVKDWEILAIVPFYWILGILEHINEIREEVRSSQKR